MLSKGGVLLKRARGRSATTGGERVDAMDRQGWRAPGVARERWDAVTTIAMASGALADLEMLLGLGGSGAALTN